MQISKQVTEDQFIEWTTLLWQNSGIVEQSHQVNGGEIWKGVFSVKDYGMEWDPWGENEDEEESQMLLVSESRSQDDEDESRSVAVISMLISFAIAVSIYGIQQGKRQAIADDVDDSYIRA